MAGVAYRAPVLPVNRYGHPIVTSFALNLQRGKPICNGASQIAVGQVHLHVLVFGYALRCTTLRVVGITTRSVVQLSLPTQVFRLNNALARLPDQATVKRRITLRRLCLRPALERPLSTNPFRTPGPKILAVLRDR